MQASALKGGRPQAFACARNGDSVLYPSCAAISNQNVALSA